MRWKNRKEPGTKDSSKGKLLTKKERANSSLKKITGSQKLNFCKDSCLAEKLISVLRDVPRK